MTGRYRASVFPTGTGSYLLRMVATNGTGGSAEFASQAEAIAAIPALYAELTGPLPAVSGLASARQTPRQEITP